MRSLLATIILGLSLGACGSHREGKESELLQLVPEDAAVVVTTADWSSIRSRSEDNHWVGLVRGATWRDLSSMVRQVTSADLEQGLDLLPAMASIQGEFVAYVRIRGELLEPELGFVIQTSDAGADFEEFWQRFTAFVARKGTSVRSEYGGAQINVVTHQEDTVLFSNSSFHAVTFAREAGVALAAAKEILDRHTGPAGASILDAPRFREACAQRAEDPALRVFVDGPALSSLTRSFLDNGKVKPLDQLGITSTRWVLADFDLGAGERFDLVIAAQLAEDTALGSLLSHLGPVPRRFAQAVPRDAVQVVLGNVDLLATFQALREFLRQVSPTDDARLQRNLDEMQTEMGLDFEQDLLAPLTGRFASMGLPVAHSNAQLMEIWSGRYSPITSLAFTSAPTIGFELRKAQAADHALRTIEQLARKDSGFAQATMSGIEVNRVHEDPLFSPHWGRYENLVFFSIMDASIRASLEFLTGKSRRSFADRPGVDKAVSEFSKACLLGIVRTRFLVELGLGMLRAYLQDSRNHLGQVLQLLQEIRWPHMLHIEELFNGVFVVAFTREADQIELALSAR